ncbi:transcriptional regulator, TrmB [Kribbella flavida DSM 17836]|uniref:Transcriptional regulator, TrmB n=1 Tax=Kribbella flavida (strain DSM 17836 / JCM 10339 / NBRC 14399) TaxID=479435 RepID=D2PM50_KRIFD|nr:helix-turn-helix domain-containing protein [Kribbella flavida]ADB34418.1 transcriptional regulator, TrmB [Kribbella flavida DSM 17836]
MRRSTGLGAENEAIYLALVRQGAATVTELAERAGSTLEDVLRAVDALQSEGFVHRTPPPRELVVPVPPELAVEQLVQRQEEELERVREAAYRLAAEAYNQAGNRRTEELIEIVSGQTAVNLAFDRVQRTARQEVRELVAPPYAASAEVNRTQLARQADGVVYRVIYDSSALEDSLLSASAVSHVRAGEQARIADDLPTKLAVADRELALLPLDWATPAHDAALLVHPCSLLDALVALFETVWGRASPLSVTAGETLAAEDPLSADDRYLLSLLVAGLTDEAAAARLGTSRRTVARRVQLLMERTHSRSRLQLGWHARERGWL